MNIARLHVIYSLLLAHCLSLSQADENTIAKEWQCAIYGAEEIPWPSIGLEDIEQYIPGARHLRFDLLQSAIRALPWDHPLKRLAEIPRRAPASVKICSMPTQLEMLAAALELSRLFDLRGVPGFYFEEVTPGPRANDVRAQVIADYGPWRINLPSSIKTGLLAPYYNGTQYVMGIQIYRSVRDRAPFLLSSSGKPGGAAAIACRERAA